MTAARAIVGVGTLVLLLSFGGAIIASPVLLGLLWWAARDASPIARRLLAVLAALVVAETVWALAYVTVGEHNPLIWIAPAVFAVGGAMAIGRSHFTSRQVV